MQQTLKPQPNPSSSSAWTPHSASGRCGCPGLCTEPEVAARQCLQMERIQGFKAKGQRWGWPAYHHSPPPDGGHGAPHPPPPRSAELDVQKGTHPRRRHSKAPPGLQAVAAAWALRMLCVQEPRKQGDASPSWQRAELLHLRGAAVTRGAHGGTCGFSFPPVTVNGPRPEKRKDTRGSDPLETEAGGVGGGVAPPSQPPGRAEVTAGGKRHSEQRALEAAGACQPWH